MFVIIHLCPFSIDFTGVIWFENILNSYFLDGNTPQNKLLLMLLLRFLTFFQTKIVQLDNARVKLQVFIIKPNQVGDLPTLIELIPFFYRPFTLFIFHSLWLLVTHRFGTLVSFSYRIRISPGFGTNQLLIPFSPFGYVCVCVCFR